MRRCLALKDSGYSFAADTHLAGCPGVLSLWLPWCLKYAFALTQYEFDTSFSKLHPKSPERLISGKELTVCKLSQYFHVVCVSKILLLLHCCCCYYEFHLTSTSLIGWTARTFSTYAYVALIVCDLPPFAHRPHARSMHVVMNWNVSTWAVKWLRPAGLLQSVALMWPEIIMTDDGLHKPTPGSDLC